LKKISIK